MCRWRLHIVLDAVDLKCVFRRLVTEGRAGWGRCRTYHNDSTDAWHWHWPLEALSALIQQKPAWFRPNLGSRSGTCSSRSLLLGADGWKRHDWINSEVELPWIQLTGYSSTFLVPTTLLNHVQVLFSRWSESGWDCTQKAPPSCTRVCVTRRVLIGLLASCRMTVWHQRWYFALELCFSHGT